MSDILSGSGGLLGSSGSASGHISSTVGLGPAVTVVCVAPFDGTVAAAVWAFSSTGNSVDGDYDLINAGPDGTGSTVIGTVTIPLGSTAQTPYPFVLTAVEVAEGDVLVFNDPGATALLTIDITPFDDTSGPGGGGPRRIPLVTRFAYNTNGLDAVTSLSPGGGTFSDADAGGDGTLIHFDPDEYGVTKCRLKADAFIRNNNATGDLTIALYPVESYSGAGIVRGAQVGPTIVVPNGAPYVPISVISSNFDAPAVGDYVLTVNDGGDQWVVDLSVTLEGVGSVGLQLDALLASYEVVAETMNSISLPSGTAGDNFWIDRVLGSNIVVAPENTNAGIVYFDPAKYAVPGRTTVCRIAAATPSVGGGSFVGAGLDFKLFEMAPYDNLVGHIEAGVQVGETLHLEATPEAVAASADFELPAGWYLLAVAADDENVNVMAQVALEVRRV